MENIFRRWFEAVVAHPRAVLLGAAVWVMVFASFLPGIRFDDQPDSFLPPGHPALVAKQTVERTFGLEDPILIGILTGRPDGIFSPGPLRRIRDLTARVEQRLHEMFPERLPAHPVNSLATELDVEFSGGILHETPYLVPFPETEEELRKVRNAVLRLELYTGWIVSADGSAGGIVVFPPPGEAEAVYDVLRGIVRDARGEEPTVCLAGEVVVRSAMGEAVMMDALRLNPFCMAVVTLFLVLAFRSVQGVLLPLLVVGTACVTMLGTMILFDKPVYIITNSILVTVMSLGVADSIHVLGEYYDELRRGSFRDRRELVVRAMLRLRMPILCTSLTDAVGFLSFLLTGQMPPFQWFGCFTALGILASMVASFTLLPAGLAMLDPSREAHQRRKTWAVSGWMAHLLGRLGGGIHSHPRPFAVASIVLLILAALQGSRLGVNQSMVSAFDEESEIARTDRRVNDVFGGTYFLDVLLEKQGPGDLLEPEILHKIERLEEYATGLPTVASSGSLAGYARKMNHILNDWDDTKNRIPETAGEIREQFSLLEASPTKKAQLLRYATEDFRMANVRLRLSSGWFDDERLVVESLRSYLKQHFPPDGPVRATLAGRVTVDYHWVKLIARGHLASVGSTLVIITVLIALQFRSLPAALLCLVPVLGGVVATYAAMVSLGIDLNVGTSMFASLTIGVGVNFPIHMLHRLKARLREADSGEARAYRRLFWLTGKALCFNTFAICFGFLVLLASELPLLRQFGLMIALGIGASSLTSLILLPALSAWLRPGFLYGNGRR